MITISVEIVYFDTAVVVTYWVRYLRFKVPTKLLSVCYILIFIGCRLYKELCKNYIDKRRLCSANVDEYLIFNET